MIIGWQGALPPGLSLTTGTKVVRLLGVNWHYSVGYEYNGNAQWNYLRLLVGGTNDVGGMVGRRRREDNPEEDEGFVCGLTTQGVFCLSTCYCKAT